MAKIYLYKMTADNGGAPCVSDGVLSLAICKPAIRRLATCGDCILGFAGNRLYENNCLIYAAKISRCVNGSEYYSNREFTNRADCIYEFVGDTYRRRGNARYHSDADLSHDLGKYPIYQSARVIVAEQPSDFRYFGSSCPVVPGPELSEFIRSMKRGHRIKLSESLTKDVQSLLSNVFKTLTPQTATPVPAEHCPSKCGIDDGDAECEC